MLLNVSGKALDVSRAFEKAGFEKTYRTRPELFEEKTLNGSLYKFSSVGVLYFCKKRSERAVVLRTIIPRHFPKSEF
jgi:hypothetical protein